MFANLRVVFFPTARLAPLKGVCLFAALVFIGCLSGANAAVPRLSVSGSQILAPSGKPILLRGFNWDQYAQQSDAAANAAMGANVMRMTLGWYEDAKKDCSSSFPGTKFDAYSPNSPGNVDPALLAQLDAKIAWATSQKLWVILAIRGGNCNFWTDPAIVSQYTAMWAFLARRYKNTPYMGIYELLSEPHPTDGRTDNAAVRAIYEKAIGAIRSVDADTPVMVGPAPTYNIRNVDDIYLAGQKNVIYTANFYELKKYVKQTRAGPPPYTGYPGSYADPKASSMSCRYPGAGEKTVYMDKAFLAGLMSCLTNFRTAHNVPVFVQQVGIRSGAPGSFQWARDVLDILNSDNIGWAYWVYRKEYHSSGKGLLADDIGVVWQDSGGAWHPKTDWLGMIGAHMGGGTPAPH